ncbi:hypothetical protein ABT160_37585 [Streptomyces sp. NPDC001941]|uniref:hypothetical protein n=1 Tax=Streptomyces sp. NPDC001941 TaxID=3154659 RepID=UPI0033272E10
MSDEKKLEGVVAMENHMPVPPKKDTGSPILQGENHMPVPPLDGSTAPQENPVPATTDGGVVTMENHMPVPPKKP